MTTSSPKSRQSPKSISSPSKSEKNVFSSPSKQSKSVAMRPSAEDLVDLERELQKLISRKIQADSNLVKIETKLYDLENEYLNEIESKCLYALSLYKNDLLFYNENSYLTEGIPNPVSVEGAPKQLYYFIN